MRAGLLCGCLALLAAPVIRAQETAEEPAARGSYSDEIAVAEVGILVELPDSPNRPLGGLEASDLLVIEDGERREVTRLVSARGEPWQLLIYVEGSLTEGDTVRYAARTLGAEARALAALGRVRVVVADPEPRDLLRATREPGRIADALEAVATGGYGINRIVSLRRDFGRANSLDEAAPETVAARYLKEENRILQDRADHLILETVTACPLGPCMLLLIADGFDPEPAAFYYREIDRGAPADLAARAQEISRQTAKTLAAYGVTTVALPLRQPASRDRRPPRDSVSDFERWTEQLGGTPAGEPQAGKNRFSGFSPEVFDLYLRRELEPLREIGAATAGGALQLASQIPSELERVTDRWWVWYRTPVAEGAEVRAVEVHFAEDYVRARRRSAAGRLGLLPETEIIRHPRWRRTGTPTTVSEARIRDLLRPPRRLALIPPSPGELRLLRTLGKSRGSSPPSGCGPSGERCAAATAQGGELRLSLRSERSGSGSRTIVLEWPVPEGHSGVATAFRISTASSGPDGGFGSDPVDIEHQTVRLKPPPPGGRWRYELAWPLAPGERWAVAVEELRAGRWGGQALELVSLLR